MEKEATFLSDPTKAMIGDLIHSKLGNGMHLESELSSGPKWKFRAVENYQSQKCWDVYGSTQDEWVKLHCMAQQLAGLGITPKHADETTFGIAASLALYSSPNHDPNHYLFATRK